MIKADCLSHELCSFLNVIVNKGLRNEKGIEVSCTVKGIGARMHLHRFV